MASGYGLNGGESDAVLQWLNHEETLAIGNSRGTTLT
jgi:hypothetical protein